MSEPARLHKKEPNRSLNVNIRFIHNILFLAANLRARRGKCRLHKKEQSLEDYKPLICIIIAVMMMILFIVVAFHFGGTESGLVYNRFDEAILG